MVRHVSFIVILSIFIMIISGCRQAVTVSATPQPIVLPEPKATQALSYGGGVDSSEEPELPESMDEDEFFAEPETEPKEVNIVIDKSGLTLELYGDGEVFARFPISFGSAEGHKEKEGDKRTPEGEYYVCSRKDNTSNTLFLGISYPNIEDAKAGYEAGLIDKKTRDSIITAIGKGKRPPWDTALGGAIGIHGKYELGVATQGCIAVSDENVQIVWQYAKTGTKVEILP